MAINMKKSLLLLVVAIVFSSCNETKKVADIATDEIPSGRYEMMSVQGAPVYKLEFEIDASENKISGKTNCNTYGGNYTITNNEIKIGPLAVTKMYCEENNMEEERRIFEAFENAKTFVYDNNMFILSSEKEIILRAFRIIEKK